METVEANMKVIRGRDDQRNHREHNRPPEYRGMEASEGVEGAECPPSSEEIRMRSPQSEERNVSRESRNEVRARHHSPSLERSRTIRPTETISMGSNVVLGSLNCFGFKAPIVSELIIALSENHSKDLILCLQETWKYSLPVNFINAHSARYKIVHVSAMEPSIKRSGRPFV